MKLTKGQLRTLDSLHVLPEWFCDEALTDFFNYTDRGMKPARITDEFELSLWPKIVKPLGSEITKHGIRYTYRHEDYDFFELYGRFIQKQML